MVNWRNCAEVRPTMAYRRTRYRYSRPANSWPSRQVRKGGWRFRSVSACLDATRNASTHATPPWMGQI